MATNKLLYNPVPTYRKFVDNQVLTDDQLNGVLDHLNYQDQLSRVLLSGVGIVCGLRVSLAKDKKGVRLSAGAAITTDGNLLKADGGLYKGFKRFKDSNVKYPSFLADEETTMKLWELEPDATASNVWPLNKFEDKTHFSLDEAYAVLYLEDYLKEQEDCSPVSCDTQGREAVHKLRLLLVSPEDIQTIAQGDTIFAGLLQDGEKPALQDITHMYTPRVVLNPANTATYDKFKKAYKVPFSKLAKRIDELSSIKLFSEIFEKESLNPVAELENLPVTFRSVQYLYDLYKDLVTAYNEVQSLLKKNFALCCPEPTAFSKHVMLGALEESEISWRHRFYPSPAHDGCGSLDKMQTAFSRLLLMIKNFKADIKKDIRITPSRKDDARLGQRAIPFYYDLETSSPNRARFYDNWKEQKDEPAPNYYGYGYDFNALDVCLDGHDFYRIEGHVGRDVTDAHKEIQAIQKGKGLAFDITPIAVGQYPDEEIIDYDKYRVYFEDLQAILQAWNEEQQCIVKSASKFLTEFSTAEPGAHVGYVANEVYDANESSGMMDMEPMVVTPVYTAYYGEAASKGTKKKKNQVVVSLANAKNTLGNTITNVINSSDNKNDIWAKTNSVLASTLQNWNPDLVEATINIPAQVVGYLKETEDHMLTNIEDFTEENLRKYIKSLQAQCRKTRASKKKLQRLIDKEQSVVRSKAWTEQYVHTLNRIQSSCCLIEKVKVLYHKIMDRKKEILEQLVLDRFIDQHPGAEHKAGVPKGGTFVLLYFSRKSEPKENTEMLMERLVPSSEEMIAQPIVMQSAGLELNRPVKISHGIEGTQLGQPLERGAVLGDPPRRFPHRENIPHGTVIGDLCLPYICCSQSPPTQFVFPEQLATLRLPVDHVCMEEEEETDNIAMDIRPAGGKVKAFIQKRELSNVIIGNQNGTYFNPNKVAQDDYGKVIRFEVNGQPVEPTLELYRKPNADFSVSDDDITFERKNTQAIVTFKNTSEPFNELSFTWDFAGESVENQDALSFRRTFAVQPGENFDFKVKLTASNGPCEATITKSVNIDVPALEEPGDPGDNCIKVTAETIKASLELIDKEFKANEDKLDKAFQSLYKQRLNPLYKQILTNPEKSLAGDMDDEVFEFIQSTHFKIQKAIGQQKSTVQQEFSLKIYYELILLYFYLQACRDKKIKVDGMISDVAPDWIKFTDQATKKLAAALKVLFTQDRIDKKLVSLQKQLKERFDPEIAKIVAKLIKKLKDYFG